MGVYSSERVSVKASLGHAALAIAFLLCGAERASAAPCDWKSAKADVDSVLEGDAAKSEAFRALIAKGRDSLEAVESLADEAAKPRLRDCGYEAAEYLTKRGYPPFH